MKMRDLWNNEKGSALVLSILVLVILTIIGIGATNTTTTDLTISRNQKVHKVAFYAADGGAEAGIELVEQNIDEKNWSDNSDHGDCKVVNGDFYMNADLGSTETPGDSNRDVYTPKAYSAGNPHTNLRIGGNTDLSSGGAIQMISGYGGTGFGSAGAGAWVNYDIRAQHQGEINSTCVVNIMWRHLL